MMFEGCRRLPAAGWVELDHGDRFMRMEAIAPRRDDQGVTLGQTLYPAYPAGLTARLRSIILRLCGP